MKNKIFSVLVGLLAVFLGACSDNDDVLTTSSVHVNGGPLEESITPTSARVRIRLNETAGIGEVGICYGVQTDKSALLSYGCFKSRKGRFCDVSGFDRIGIGYDLFLCRLCQI